MGRHCNGSSLSSSIGYGSATLYPLSHNAIPFDRFDRSQRLHSLPRLVHASSLHSIQAALHRPGGCEISIQPDPIAQTHTTHVPSPPQTTPSRRGAADGGDHRLRGQALRGEVDLLQCGDGWEGAFRRVAAAVNVDRMLRSRSIGSPPPSPISPVRTRPPTPHPSRRPRSATTPSRRSSPTPASRTTARPARAPPRARARTAARATAAAWRARASSP